MLQQNKLSEHEHVYPRNKQQKHRLIARNLRVSCPGSCSVVVSLGQVTSSHATCDSESMSFDSASSKLDKGSGSFTTNYLRVSIKI